jgi:hypothetical protein
VLIGRMLKAKVVLADGVVIGVDEGVPQGSPLSPRLFNVVLDELDRELARRGHRFVRYADDCNVYVRSERAGTRVMAGLTGFIQWRLCLRINAGKSAVAKPKDRHFRGFCLRIVQHGRRRPVEVGLSERTTRKVMAHVRQLTPRTWGGTLESAIARINTWLVGWHPFFGIASADEQQRMGRIDATYGAGCTLRCTTRSVDERSLAASSRWASSRSTRGARSTPAKRRRGPSATPRPSITVCATRTAPPARSSRWPRCTAADARTSPPLPIQPRLGAGTERGREPAGGGVTTSRPEEPCANSASTILWEPGRQPPRLPDSQRRGRRRAKPALTT